MSNKLPKLALVLTVAMLVGLGSRAGWAREGFYIGAGFAGQTAKGDLDGQSTFLDADGNRYLVGSLNSGVGVALQIGYGFNKYLGIEYFQATTSHTASHQLAPDSDALLSSGVLGVRLTAPVSKAFELFLRAGLGGYELSYDKYAQIQPSYTQTTAATYTGYGSAYGAGFEIFSGHLGIGLGYTVHSATFNKVKASGQGTADPPNNLHVPITTTDLTFSYHFGGGGA